MAISSDSNTGFRVTPEVLQKRAAAAAEKIDVIERQLMSIRRTVKGTGNYWIGEAGNGWREQYERQQDKTEELLRRLKEQPVTLLAIANRYSSVEVEVKEKSMPLPIDVID